MNGLSRVPSETSLARPLEPGSPTGLPAVEECWRAGRHCRQPTQQLAAVNVRVEDVLHDLQAIAHTDLQTLSAQSGMPARWKDKLKALELLMKHLGLAAPEQHQYLHHHVHFTPDHLSRMTDEQLDRAEAAYTVIVTLEQKVAAAHSAFRASSEGCSWS